MQPPRDTLDLAGRFVAIAETEGCDFLPDLRRMLAALEASHEDPAAFAHAVSLWKTMDAPGGIPDFLVVRDDRDERVAANRRLDELKLALRQALAPAPTPADQVWAGPATAGPGAPAGPGGAPAGPGGGQPPATPGLPARGSIASFDVFDRVGTIKLETGETVSFREGVCAGFVPAVGVSVFIADLHPPLRGMLRAKVVNLTGDPAETRDALLRRAEAERAAAAARRAVELRELEAERARALAALPGGWELARTLPVLAPAVAFRERCDEAAIAKAVRRLTPVEPAGLVLDGFRWFENPSDALRPPVDPCLFPLGGGSDALGVFVYPPAIAEGLPLPVVFFFHERDPALSWVAESLEHLGRMVERGGRRKATAAERGTAHPLLVQAIAASRPRERPADEERALVYRFTFLPEEGDEAAARLASRYEAPGWEYARASLRYQLAAKAFDDRADALRRAGR